MDYDRKLDGFEIKNEEWLIRWMYGGQMDLYLSKLLSNTILSRQDD